MGGVPLGGSISFVPFLTVAAARRFRAERVLFGLSSSSRGIRGCAASVTSTRPGATGGVLNSKSPFAFGTRAGPNVGDLDAHAEDSRGPAAEGQRVAQRITRLVPQDDRLRRLALTLFRLDDELVRHVEVRRRPSLVLGVVDLVREEDRLPLVEGRVRLRDQSRAARGEGLAAQAPESDGAERQTPAEIGRLDRLDARHAAMTPAVEDVEDRLVVPRFDDERPLQKQW